MAIDTLVEYAGLGSAFLGSCALTLAKAFAPSEHDLENILLELKTKEVEMVCVSWTRLLGILWKECRTNLDAVPETLDVESSLRKREGDADPTLNAVNQVLRLNSIIRKIDNLKKMYRGSYTVIFITIASGLVLQIINVKIKLPQDAMVSALFVFLVLLVVSVALLMQVRRKASDLRNG